ncbi:GNAT family N-acetyltransferase [Leptolyngbya sp. FACHB-711]|uniref:GNAT family N-acetyltransferase n=1 Tax=unclassified Leptolyngbya TaxID=2650499 RepID=UPI001686783B|nr:GNAT family N-acetyltransferase [Leptolyngbya sp. FACHB-711]MBD1851312.1 GNAT family N-acetyltransferase [Cyanobacteria bacterium FACHB-502]MBD2026597.1 GNAT family N-acetyltransferase [Leptolyngbya sp. FACHB-711]
MSQQTYLKVPFVWEEPKPLIEVPSRLKFKAAKTLDYEVLLSVVAEVMESSIDASDRKQVMERGSREVAEQFLAESKDGFSYRDEWWQIGLSSDDRVIGFVFPVIYQNGAKNGLEEATIYYIGVLPEYRGLGFATDLLLKGTRVLQDVGIWRVFCDADVNNIPMISTFERAGYQQHSEPWQRPL